MVQPEEIGIVGVLVLDDDGDVLEGCGQVGWQLVERCSHVVVERHLITSAISAFCVCNRFSACSHARQRGP